MLRNATLNPQQIAVLNSASPTQIEAAFIGLQTALAARGWMPTTNAYRIDIINGLDADQRQNTINSANLCQYIAASAPLHCADGWSLLGRAISAHNVSDPDASRHFAYYAELRAAMSILACQGIGIFSDKHYVIDNNGGAILVNDVSNRGWVTKIGTHQITWKALALWSSTAACGDLLFDVVRVGGVRLRDWLNAFSGVQTANLVATESVRSWGLDLQYLLSDHNARNSSSYRPTGIERPSAFSLSDGLKFVVDLWQLAEPAGAGEFGTLDMHLLRDILRRLYRATRGPLSSQAAGDYANRVQTAINAVVADPQMAASLSKFLSMIRQESVLLRAAKRNNSAQAAGQHLQVIARAFLLLRLATGCTVRLLRSAGYTSSTLEFWWRELGVERGLWRPNDEPNDLRDLWTDVEVALEKITGWHKDKNSAEICYAAYQDACGGQLFTLGSCERVVIWSFAS